MGALGIGLKLLGFGKVILGFLGDAIASIFKFALEKPFQFLTISLSIALVCAGWYGFQTKQELTETQTVVKEKVQFIEKQGVTIKEYVKALDTEKKNHVNDIKKSNIAVESLKKAADEALARAQAAGREIEKDKVKYQALATKYSQANSSAGTADDRIKREEQTTDSFLNDWRKAK